MFHLLSQSFTNKTHTVESWLNFIDPKCFCSPGIHVLFWWTLVTILHFETSIQGKGHSKKYPKRAPPCPKKKQIQKEHQNWLFGWFFTTHLKNNANRQIGKSSSPKNRGEKKNPKKTFELPPPTAGNILTSWPNQVNQPNPPPMAQAQPETAIPGNANYERNPGWNRLLVKVAKGVCSSSVCWNNLSFKLLTPICHPKGSVTIRQQDNDTALHAGGGKKGVVLSRLFRSIAGTPSCEISLEIP